MTDAQISFKSWIGRSEEPPSDLVTRRLIEQFRATLGRNCFTEDAVPPGFHWCLATPTVYTDALGEDGHPKNGSFLPPIPLTRRMWAGGEVEFLRPFKVNAEVTKRSIIKSIVPKEGKSGPLCFVTVEHLYLIASDVAVRDLQKIVYRDGELPSGSSLPTSDKGWSSDYEETVQITSTMLFRYSALTFNAHRIHYDFPYTTKMEGYQGLVTHGPLQATLLLNFASRTSGLRPKYFIYKGVAPAIAPQTLKLKAEKSRKDAKLRICSESGVTTMEAKAFW